MVQFIEETKDECALYCTENYSSEGTSTNINNSLGMNTKEAICQLKTGFFSTETLKMVHLRQELP